MKVLALSLAILFFLSGTAHAQEKARANEVLPELNDEDEVRLIVFNELLKPWRTKPLRDDLTPGISFYFEIEGEKDPSNDLIRSLGDAPAPIKKSSDSYISKAGGSIVLDRKTDRPGVLFRIYKLSRKGQDTFLVSAGTYQGNMGAFECDYIAKRYGSGWKIASADNCSIS